MALGDDNGSKNTVYSNTFYSRLKFRNSTSRNVLGFCFRNGLLIVNINEEKDGFKYEELASINLSPAKAYLLRDQLKVFEDDYIAALEGGEIDPNKAYGVNAGFRETVTFIAFRMTGERSENGAPFIGVTIGKVDQDGTVHDNYEFIFNTDYHYSLTWTNLSNMDFIRNSEDGLELKLFCSVLDEYIGSMSGVSGYMAFDIGRYELNRMVKPIYDKLGIDFSRNRSEGSSGGGFFMNQPQSGGSSRGGSVSRSVDDLDNLMG